MYWLYICIKNPTYPHERKWEYIIFACKFRLPLTYSAALGKIIALCKHDVIDVLVDGICVNKTKCAPVKYIRKTRFFYGNGTERFRHNFTKCGLKSSPYIRASFCVPSNAFMLIFNIFLNSVFIHIFAR